MPAPHGFDATEYASWSLYKTDDLEAIVEDCKEGIETLTEMRNMITHILIRRADEARQAAKLYPDAAGCHDCTQEAKRL